MAYVVSDDARTGPAGEVLATNIRGYYAPLSDWAMPSCPGCCPDPAGPSLNWVCAVSNAGERRVDVDDLLALCVRAEGLHPVDLMVDRTAATEAYPITPKLQFTSRVCPGTGYVELRSAWSPSRTPHHRSRQSRNGHLGMRCSTCRPTAVSRSCAAGWRKRRGPS